MRILILTQWFHPEPDFKGLPFAKELARRGHDVEVLTGFPNYPGGELYDGYRLRPMLRETIEGIPVIRVPLYPSHDGSSIRRILNYVSFSFTAALLGPFLVRPADVVYVYHAPATIALPAVILSIFRRVPFVYDINDLWPDSIAASGMLRNKMALAAVGLWSRLTYKVADRIVVNSPGCKGELAKRGADPSKIDVIYNWCDEQQLGVATRLSEGNVRPPPMQGRFNIVFAGTMGKVQALDTILDAAVLLGRKLPKVQFVFVGGGVELNHLKQRATREAISNVLFLPRRPVGEIGDLLRVADVLLVHLKDQPLFRITIPSKTQAYLSFGRPILMGVSGDAADLIMRAHAGVASVPEDPESISEAVEKLFSMTPEERGQLGKNGRDFYLRELSMSAGVDRFERIFALLCGRRSKRKETGESGR